MRVLPSFLVLAADRVEHVGGGDLVGVGVGGEVGGGKDDVADVTAGQGKARGEGGEVDVGGARGAGWPRSTCPG